MSWTLLVGIVVVLGLALLAVALRHMELKRMAATMREHEDNVRQGRDKAQLQHPVVDLSRCLGCATCVAACPEDNVLELVHGQAMVVNGGNCRGISACERECPVGAITITIANLSERDDIPVLSELEAVGTPGLFLAGEVTAHALIKTAVDQGAAVGAEVARRLNGHAASDPEVLDLCVVGAGPAGLACSLEAKRNGLAFVTLDQAEQAGGTVATYPRRKLVMTQPVELPMYGRFRQTTYAKEELVDLWHGIVDEQQLPIRGSEVFTGLRQEPDQTFLVQTQANTYRARNVCLALGRRGSPRKLGVLGEDLPKVAYSLQDAQSYQGRRVLVVGGGDSAVEAALGLAEQPGNQVVLSYRNEELFRVRSKNRARIDRAVAEGRVTIAYRSQVVAIHPEAVELSIEGESGAQMYTLPNDDVFVMIGGIAPFDLLKRSGVSFDRELHDPVEPLIEQGTGILRALGMGFALALMTLAWALWHRDYYGLPRPERPAHEKHLFLRPGMGLGLWLGITSTVMIVVNLVYLLRRSPRFKLQWGSLKLWMTSHVATGILALLCAMLHAAMAPRNTVGGHAFWALGVLLVTGAIGRYFYAWIPRAANGRELELKEVKGQLDDLLTAWGASFAGFGAEVRERVFASIEKRQWRGTLAGRILALLGVQFDMRRLTRELTERGRAQGISEAQIEETVAVAARAHRTALLVAHYEDVRALLNGWRYIHRWVAALMVLLLVVHIVSALSYSSMLYGGR